MSRLEVYDNWGKLVGAVIDREELQRLAFCDSFSSTSSSAASISRLSSVSSSFDFGNEENWFTVDGEEPIAHAVVGVIEATEMTPSFLNGLADPHVKGQLGPYRFRTRIQKKTLAPVWNEEFKIPIITWEAENILVIKVQDRDRLFGGKMGDCSVNINKLRDGERHDIWLPLQNIKMGRLHLAVTVIEGNGEDAEPSSGSNVSDSDKFEPIDVQGQSETGICMQQPGEEVLQLW